MTDLIDRHDKRLKTEVAKFDFSSSVDAIEIAHFITKKMLELNVMSLSAPQVGLPYRCFAINSSPVLFCFNPVVVDVSEDHIYMEEACSSFPGTVLKIKRPEVIKVRYAQPNSEVVTKKFGGMTARLFLHELDHLNGILFTQRATKYHLDRGLKHQKIKI